MHLSLLFGIVIPFAGLLVPLFVWFTKKDSSSYAHCQGLEMINFLINIFIFALGTVLLCVLVVGVLLVVPVLLFAFIMPIIAAVKCSKGNDFSYPIIYRFIK